MVGKYKVITLCGSTKFKDQYLEAQKRLTLEGNIVISVGLFGHSGDDEVWTEGTKAMLDDMHKRKIDMADEIFVINVGGYLGESTRGEIEYAKSRGMVVKYLEEQVDSGLSLCEAFSLPPRAIIEKKQSGILLGQMPSEQYGSPVYLTLDDVDVIARADFSDDKELEIQRDIFVFQCNVGCRIGDLLRLKKRDIINGAVEYIPTKTIKERAKTVVVPLNAIAMSIVEKYKDVPGDQLLPFISSQNYNENIKTILEKAGITYLVTELDTLTRTEKKVPINEIASSHMARRTFIGNIYKLVKDPNLVSALTGHAEGSRAFNRYRDIDIDMKRDLVKILEGKH